MTLTVTFDEEEAEQITDFKGENNLATDEDAVRRLVLLGLAADLKAWHEKLK